MTALHDLAATELVARYRERSLSPVEVTRAVLDRIAAWEPHLHATYLLDGEAALAAARVSEARWLRHVSAGENVGALEGVPTMIKENIATAGTPVPLGTAATELVPALRDAPPAARLREAGAVILGKTTMPDYGMLSSGLSSFHGLTRNPWDLSKNPGGSSSGAAAARRRRLRAAAPRHRHRRLGAIAGRLVRHLHPEAEPRPDPDRSAVRRPRRRADDSHRRRRGADDGRAGPARRPRHDEPAGAIDRLAAARARRQRPAHRLAARHRHRPAGRRRGRGRGRGRRQALRGRGRPRRAHGAVPDPRDARRHGRLLAHARLARHVGAARGAPRARPALHQRLGAARPGPLGRARLSRLQPDGGDARRRRRRVPALRHRALADLADPELLPPSGRARPTIPSGRSSTSPSRCRTT